MTSTVHRRTLFGYVGAAIAAAALSACTVNRVGSVTTFTLDVEKVKAYAQGGILAAATTSTILLAYPQMAKYNTIIKSTVSTLTDALEAFDTLAGDRATISYNDANAGTIVTSIYAGIKQVVEQIHLVSDALANSTLSISPATLAKIDMAEQALDVLVSAMKVMLTSMQTTAAMSPAEHKALQTLRAVHV